MRIDILKPIFSENDQQALRNTERLRALGLTAVNILASPGAGKTSVIVRLLEALRPLTCGVIEGDVAGSIDTDKIRALGFPATQINTDGGCHLDAEQVDKAIGELGIRGPGLVFIENVGNLICPAEFRLGESLRLVIASVPEGDDKPVKYPSVFSYADGIVLNKTDLLGLVEFEPANFEAGVRAVNKDAPIFPVSCRKTEGIEALVAWLKTAVG